MKCDHCGSQASAMDIRNARIIELAKQGKTRKQIMETLGLSPRIVYQTIRKAGVKPGKSIRGAQMLKLAANLDKVKSMVAEGLTHQQIAVYFRMCKSTVDKFILNNGMRTRAKRGTGTPRVKSEGSDPYAYAARTRQYFDIPINRLQAGA